MDKGFVGFENELQYYFSRETLKGFKGVEVFLDTNLSRDIFKGFRGYSIEFAINFVLTVVEKAAKTPIEGAEVTIFTPTGNYTLTTPANGVVELFLKDGESVKIEKCPFDEINFVFNRAQFPKLNNIIELTSDPCVFYPPINDFNFLRWNITRNYSLPATGAIGYCTGLCDDNGAGVVFDLPAADKEFYALPVAFGDEISFFINSETPLAYPGIENYKIGLANCGKLLNANIGELEAVPVGIGYRLKGVVTIPNLEVGQYNLVIYDPATMGVILISNALRVLFGPNVEQDTIIVKYRNPANMVNFMYEQMPGFYNVFRLDAKVTDEQTPQKSKTYTDTWTGATYYIGAPILERTALLETYAFDTEAHAATAVMLAQNEIIIEGREYMATEGYERENEGGDPGNLLTNGKAKLNDKNFYIKGITCQ